jgi:hypothetical protein
VPPPALAIQYVVQSDFETLLSIDGLVGRLDDNSSGAIDGPEPGYLGMVCNWSTAEVNKFCLGRYPAEGLAGSWTVWNWAVVVGANWLSGRRGNPPPGSYKDLAALAYEEMKAVRSGEINLPDIGLRTAAWPTFSNIRVSLLYNLRKARVERPISEQTLIVPAPFLQNRDIAADQIVEPN